MNNVQSHYDIAVIGLGAMGAASVYQLATKGAKVIGFDQYTPPHALGSSHGETRITREAVGEGPQFVALARRSHQLWRNIEQASGRDIFTQCGALIIAGNKRDAPLHGQRDFLQSTLDQASGFGIGHEQLDAQTIRELYPQFAVSGDEKGYFEPTAGYLKPDVAIAAQLALARSLGATLMTGSKATWSRVGDSFRITANGNTFLANKLVLTAGPWLPDIVPSISKSLSVRRQLLFWFALDRSIDFGPNTTPVFIWNWGGGENEVFYGFPRVGAAPEIKLASEQTNTSTTAESIERDVGTHESVEFYNRHLASRLLGISSHCTRASACLYTCTNDANFIIDWLPDQPGIMVVSACSGHGFKHSAALGEAIAEMATTDNTPPVLSPFALNSY